MKTNIIINTRFVAYHYWENAPPMYSYLKSIHRHEFHLTIKLRVNSDDREIEFCEFKNELNEYLIENHVERTGPESCEQLCKEIYEAFNHLSIVYIRIMEDGENGSEVYFDEE